MQRALNVNAQLVFQKCIDVSNNTSLNKEQLVEIYNRIALPLPQRKYGQARHIHKKMAALRMSKSIPVAANEDKSDLEYVISRIKTII